MKEKGNTSTVMKPVTCVTYLQWKMALERWSD